MQRVLTIASIVEAETSASADRPKVARVIENRLAILMPLQLDSTVIFIAQRRGKLVTTDTERSSQSPYNTYLVTGLPPGPIDSPGLSAMKAAVSPTPGPWMYFVAVNPQTGETRFAVDAAGHAANVKLFQKWCSAHPGKCLTADARRAAVLGSPIAHSLSPALHEAAYRALGLTHWSYEAHEVQAQALHGFVAALGPEWAGLSLTMPLKEAAFQGGR